MGISERHKEIRRRRHRRKKVGRVIRKVDAASPSEKILIADKLRRLTPGAEVIIARLGLAER